MEELKEKTADLVDHVEDIADTFYRLTIINVTQKATNVASSALTMIVVTIIGFCVLLFLGVALSFWLGDLIGSRSGGFLLGGAFFLLVLLILIALRKKIVFPMIRNLIISKVYD
ncbi:phage holin family protein [Terrimonas sp. NA20]|uniref:Phage holin family protein n=1 Tax=Terrimonas ginsenosidimutans TaxID=2908004 RepID=A0ABS9KPV3_9BACT|nr:phage holin family protein [Terrimonas ginsenosidimutans]MCG2614335.1 phage holin family protein [Terrimonas ginsenosidimutans]